MTDRAFTTRLQGHGLTTAEILYHRPDAPSLLQLFVWQDYGLAPDFPALFDFVDFWNREIEAALHSIRIAHDHLLRPAQWRAVHGELRSEEHTSELQSLMRISYAVFCLDKHITCQ